MCQRERILHWKWYEKISFIPQEMFHIYLDNELKTLSIQYQSTILNLIEHKHKLKPHSKLQDLIKTLPIQFDQSSNQWDFHLEKEPI